MSDISKTKTLSKIELDALRNRLEIRFRERNPEVAWPTPNTYLGTYESLREDILKVAPELSASVSLNRLRKLFYYTNPGVCSEELLESLTFGKDFLRALEAYLDTVPSVPSPIFRPALRKRSPWVLVLLGLFVFLSVMSIGVFSSKGWREDFNTVDPTGMRARGWEIRDYDALSWANQPLPGMLALYTHPGDYWVKSGEPRMIPNVPIRKIPRGDVSINCGIVGFRPSQEHQQCGLLLLNKNKDKVEHLRINFCFGKFEGDEVQPNADAIGKYIITTVRINQYEEVYTKDFKIGRILPYEQVNYVFPYDPIILKIEIRGRSCKIFTKRGYDWRGYRYEGEATLDFTPAYVALAAFQGWTLADGTPVNAQIIPAFFDWVEVKRD